MLFFFFCSSFWRFYEVGGIGGLAWRKGFRVGVWEHVIHREIGVIGTDSCTAQYLCSAALLR
jgi:hypothetical protein